MLKPLLTAATIALAIAGTPAFAHGDHESAAGRPGNPKQVSRTVEISMLDSMRFSPSSLAVKRGETIRFVIHNAGKLRHEMMLGSEQELKEHAEMMRRMPGMSHQDANAVTVEPGSQAELVWRFDKAGAVDFACLIPGHFEAGMKGSVAVR